MEEPEAEMTFDTNNASMVSGLVDYMPTLVSGAETTASERRLSDKPPPLPPKIRVSSVDRALPGLQITKPVCIHFQSFFAFALVSSHIAAFVQQ